MKNILIFILTSTIIFIGANCLFANYIIKTEKTLNNSTLTMFDIKPSLAKFQNNSKLSTSLLNNTQTLFNYYNVKDLRVVNYLKKNGIKVSIEKNYIYKINSVSDDPMINEQWALKTLNADKAWEISQGEGIVIALIDTGLEYKHEEFDGQIWINKAEDINNNGKFDNWSSTIEFEGVYGDLDGLDNDNNGFDDDVIGYDFVNQDYMNFGDWNEIDNNPVDEVGHGTQVGGIMVAKNGNNKGISGLAYKSKLMVLRAFDVMGNAESDDVANAIIYAVENGANIINLSFGEKYSSSILHDAIKYAYSKGCVIVASSGNSALYSPHYPSDYIEVFSIGNVTKKLKRSGLSNYGSLLDFMAPGNKILTTTFGGNFNKYEVVSGTSFSAPYVSATVALLMSINNNLSQESIRNILSNSATDIGDLNWDYYNGAGIINPYNALEQIFDGEIRITNPSREIIYNKDKVDSISVIGSVHTALFDRFEILVGEGVLPDKISSTDSVEIAKTLGIDKKDLFRQDKELIKSMKWEKIFDGDKAYLNEDIFKFSIKGFADTIYTGRVKIYLKNNKILERRFIFEVNSEDNKLSILNLTAKNAIFNDKNVVLISALSNKESNFLIEYKHPLSNEIFTINNFQKNRYGHTFRIGEEIPANIESEAVVYLINGGKKVDSSSIKFTRLASGIQKNSYSLKPYSFKMSYLMDDVIESNDKKYIAFADMSNLYIDSLYLYRFDDTTFNEVKNLDEVQIPMKFADVNGNGEKELLTTARKSSFIYSNINTNFDIKLYETPLSDYQWTEGSFDFDEDGIDEIIIFDENEYYLLKYDNNEYNKYAYSYLPFEYSNVRLKRGAIAGDFDNNGTNELVFGNSNGQLFIYEYQDSKMKPKYLDTNYRAEETKIYLTKGDLESDGIDEIILMTEGNKELFGIQTDGDNVWLVEVFNWVNEKLIKKAEKMIWGVRDGFLPSLGTSFRNGINSGNLDSQNGDEIVISVFPNIYILKWDEINKNLEPRWHYPGAISNGIIIQDFDNNGINELGFSNFLNQKTTFYEYKDDVIIEPPTNFSGYANGPNSAILSWKAVAEANKYLIGILEGSIGEFIGSTNSNQVEVPGLENNRYYTFFLASESSDNDTSSVSNFLDLVDVYTHDLYSPINAELTTDNRINIEFDGQLRNGYSNLSSVYFKENDDLIFPNSSIASGNNLILTFENSQNIEKYLETEINIKSIFDVFNSPTNEAKIILKDNRKTIEDEIYLYRLTVNKENKSITLEFSEEIDESGLLIDNYSLNTFGKIIKVEFKSNKSVEVYLDEDIFTYGRGINYIITVKNVSSSNGKNITKGAGNSLGFTISADDGLNSHVFPSPVSLNEDEYMTFANLPTNANVLIYTIETNLLKELKERDGNGGVRWDFIDKSNIKILPGIYLYKVIEINENGEEIISDLKKFMVTP